MYKSYAIAFLSFGLFLLSVAVPAEEKKDGKAPYYLTEAELDKKLGVDGSTADRTVDSAAQNTVETPEQFVQVVYFHRVPGCATCQLMSQYIYETVDSRFSDDVKARKIVLRYRDLADQKNAELIKKLKVKSPALAVMIVKDGKLSKAKLPGKIWSLASDKAQFMDYVAAEIKAYQTGSKETGK